MQLYKKKKGNLEENGFASRTKDYFKEAVEKRKIKIASWLQEKSARFSSIQKKAALIVFCIVFGGTSVFILARSIKSYNFNSDNLYIHRQDEKLYPTAIPRISDSAYQRVKRAKQWLDSLKRTDSNRFKVILLSKPYLLENLQFIEHIYQSQSK